MDERKSGHASARLTLVSFCAEWCGTCREFRAVFDALAAALPAVRFVWIDIEDEPEIAGDLEIATFPTLGVLRGDVALHFGPSMPQRNAVERLLRALTTNAQAAPLDPDAAEVLRRAGRKAP